ncbi:hypothetical protein ACJ41O_011075 [Fusarium nematophilum]
MPPRPARRSSRYSSREPEQAPSHDSPNRLVRPQLPPLQGTPSSRRQYTYGSGVEPPPRVGAGLQRMDLSNAVTHALSRRDDTGVFVRPPRPQPGADAEEDELSRDGAARPTTRGHGPSNLSRQTVAGSDADSSRSFGMESDYFEDATIGSAPASTPAPETRQTASRSAPRTQQSAPEGRSSQPSRLNDRAGSTVQSNQTAARAGQARQQTQQSASESDEEEEEEETPINRNASLPHGKKTNTPAPDRAVQQRRRRQRQTSEDGDSGSEQVNRRSTRATGRQKSAAQPERPSQGGSGVSRRTTRQNTGEDPGLFAQAQDINRRATWLDKADEIPDDPRERDRAIQREIMEAEERVARERAEREAGARRDARHEAWQRRLAWFLALWPFNFVHQFLHNRRRVNQDDDFDEEEDNDDDGPVEWRRLLHPMTYVDTLIWLFDRSMDHVVSLIDRLSGIRLTNASPVVVTLRWILMGLLAMVFTFLLVNLSLPSASGFPDFPSPGSIQWTNPVSLVGKIGNIIPSVSWPSWGNEDDLDNLWKTDGEEVAKAEKYLKKYASEVASLKKDGKLHNAAIKKLEMIVPKIVHMELNKGRPVIAQEFWHALRDLMKADDSFLAFNKNGNDYEVTSERQWQAIVARLTKDPSFTAKLNVSTAGIEDHFKSKMPSFWDAWVKNNNDKISAILDKAWDKRKAAGSEREFDQRMAKIVNEQLRGNGQAVVSREEFLKHLKNEFATHRAEIRAELSEIQSQIESMVRESIRRATTDAPEGVSKADITTLVKGIVDKAIADLNLEALAKGKIHVHWHAVLKNHVNYFSVGSGATIDPKITEPTWDPWGKGVVSEEAYKKGLLGLHPLPPIAALSPWEDEGDCWCAALTFNPHGHAHGAAVSVHLAHVVIPQHIVIEHIPPRATTDPGARPRSIEVWARFEDPEVRERVRDFSVTHFPEDGTAGQRTVADPNYGPAFVLIARYEYQGAELHNGVHVHGLSEELTDIRAETDQVVVRAVTNWGAKDHTCFYRVRLFGEKATE